MHYLQHDRRDSKDTFNAYIRSHQQLQHINKISPIHEANHASKNVGTPYANNKTFRGLQTNNWLGNHLQEETVRKQLNQSYLNVDYSLPDGQFSHKQLSQNNKSSQNSNLSHIAEDRNSAIKQISRLKLTITHLQRQNKQLKDENQVISAQKMKLNQNYLNFINNDLKYQQQKQIDQQALKQKLFDEVKNERNLLLSKQKSLNQFSTQMKIDMDKLKVQNWQQIQQIKTYEEVIYKKSFQYQEMVTRRDLFQRENKQLIFLLQNLKAQNKSLKALVDTMNCNQSKYETQIKFLLQTKTQMESQIQVLLKVQQCKEVELTNCKGNAQDLHYQISKLKEINNQFMIKNQKLAEKNKKLVEERDSAQELRLLSLKQLKFEREVSCNKSQQLEAKCQVFQRKLQEKQVSCDGLSAQTQKLSKQILLLKDRERALISEEKNSRDKYLLNIQKRNKQLQDLISQNERLYKQINHLKVTQLYENGIR